MLTLQETTGPAVDPETGPAWPRWLDTTQAARYGTQILGIPIEPQTLANYRAAGKGPRWKYFGQKPLTTPAQMERWATEEALTDESPLTRRARVKGPNGAANAANPQQQRRSPPAMAWRDN